MGGGRHGAGGPTQPLPKLRGAPKSPLGPQADGARERESPRPQRPPGLALLFSGTSAYQPLCTPFPQSRGGECPARGPQEAREITWPGPRTAGCPVAMAFPRVLFVSGCGGGLGAEIPAVTQPEAEPPPGRRSILTAAGGHTQDPHFTDRTRQRPHVPGHVTRSLLTPGPEERVTASGRLAQPGSARSGHTHPLMRTALRLSPTRTRALPVRPSPAGPQPEPARASCLQGLKGRAGQLSWGRGLSEPQSPGLESGQPGRAAGKAAGAPGAGGPARPAV